MALDEMKLQKVVDVDESAISWDSATGAIVAVVFWNVCGDPGVLEWVTNVIWENVSWCQNVRVCTLCLQTMAAYWLLL